MAMLMHIFRGRTWVTVSCVDNPDRRRAHLRRLLQPRDRSNGCLASRETSSNRLTPKGPLQPGGNFLFRSIRTRSRRQWIRS